MSETLFIADLHLHLKRPHTLKFFLDFLRNQARDFQSLYILGDLFEAWLGDDDDEPAYQAVQIELAALVQAGTSVNVLHGNRDFLLGKAFAERTGCHLLPAQQVIDVYGTPTLIMHGDVLCTLDAAYQAFRQQVHHPQWQAHILALPLTQRRQLSQQLRMQSQVHTQGTQEYIMDVTHEAVLEACVTQHVTQLIHGHTHRPACHHFSVLNAPATRWVVGDWQDSGAVVLHCTPTACQLKWLSEKGLSQI